MPEFKTVKIVLDTFGNYLGMEKGCIIKRDKKGKTIKYPLFENEIGEVILKSGNMVSTGLLTALGFWGIDVLITTRNDRPIAMLKNLEDDSHVKTRICQYESLKNGKALHLVKQFVLGKLEGQEMILNKYGMKPYRRRVDVQALEEKDLTKLRRRAMHEEAESAKHYFKEIFQLFPKGIRPKRRRSFKAYAGLNNLFNLGYTLLHWKCYRAILKAHLEPYLGYLHYLKPYRANLVCDFIELYRHLIDDFLIQHSQELKVSDFKAKTEMMNQKKGKRIYLKASLTKELMNQLHEYFKLKVKIPRIKKGKQQEVETLINEEALLIAKYLRDERESWIPRVAIPKSFGGS